MKEDEFEELMDVQRNMASRLQEENKTDNKIKLIDIIRGLVPDPKEKAQTEEIIVEAKVQGLSESEVEELLSELEDDGFIEEVEPGYVRMSE